MAPPRLKVTPLPLLLSLNAEFVDTAGFLALQGLFTAHVTGNFVTLGASLVLGTSGAVAKLLALPVFCVVVMAVRLLSSALSQREFPALKILLGLKIILLIVGAALVNALEVVGKAIDRVRVVFAGAGAAARRHRSPRVGRKHHRAGLELF